MLRAVDSAQSLGGLWLSAVQCPVLSIPAQACGFFCGIIPSHIWPFSFPTAFCFSQHPCLFQGTLPHDVPEVGWLSCVISSSSNTSGLICSKTHVFIFLQSRLFIELFCNSSERLFQMHPVSLPHPISPLCFIAPLPLGILPAP